MAHVMDPEAWEKTGFHLASGSIGRILQRDGRRIDAHTIKNS